MLSKWKQFAKDSKRKENASEALTILEENCLCKRIKRARTEDRPKQEQ